MMVWRRTFCSVVDVSYNPIRSNNIWDSLVEGLKTYRSQQTTNDFITPDYVIPSSGPFPPHLHGVRLGFLLDKLRRAYHKGLLTSSQVKTLEENVMYWDYEAYKLEYISLPAILLYKKIHGNLRVPLTPPYIVPSSEAWPEILWGMKLSHQVQNWRKNKSTLSSQLVKTLNEQEFIWDINEKDFEKLLLALKMYEELNGNIIVPQSFRVPFTDPWPVSTHGYTLGMAVRLLRQHKGIDPKKDNVLTARGFIWDPVRYHFERVMLRACKIYVEQNGDLNVISGGYRVPQKSKIYPPECWGYFLGQKLSMWRENGARPDLMEEIKQLGFKRELMIDFTQEDLKTLLDGLNSFHSVLGYKERMKKTTCLPEDHPTLSGLAIGQLFHRAKKWNGHVGFSEQDLDHLKVYPSWNSVYTGTIYPLVVIFHNMYEHVLIPQIYKVPCCRPWPAWSWNQKLGLQIQNIRVGTMSISEDGKDVLENMGFKWGPKGRLIGKVPVKAVAALEHGHLHDIEEETILLLGHENGRENEGRRV